MKPLNFTTSLEHPVMEAVRWKFRKKEKKDRALSHVRQSSASGCQLIGLPCTLCTHMFTYESAVEHGCETECTDTVCVCECAVCFIVFLFLHSSAGYQSLGTCSLHAFLICKYLQLGSLFPVFTNTIHEQTK